MPVNHILEWDRLTECILQTSNHLTKLTTQCFVFAKKNPFDKSPVVKNTDCNTFQINALGMLLTSRPSHNEHTVGLSTLPTIKTWNMEAIKYIPSKWVCYTIMDATHRFFTRSPEMESENIGNRLYSRVKPYIRAKFHGKWCSGN